MTDVVRPDVRSRMMSGIRGKNTRPELAIRRGLHGCGFRYRLHDSRLPGKPDLVFPRYNAVVFVHGCFWHRHNCHLFKWPSTRTDFWRTKIEGNSEVDRTATNLLAGRGWRICTVWECALKGRTRRSTDECVLTICEWLRSEDPCLELRGVEDEERSTRVGS
jgi:DNA mismatch endonuclease (patch repair protein)